MNKRIIETDKAPAPIGPYSQAVLVNDTLYISGQIPLDAQSGELVTGDTATITKKVMENIKAILSEAEMDFTNVVKSTIFLTDMALFTEVNEVYGSYFSSDMPARETVAVKGLPKNVDVEISMIAVK